ncbi:MAG: DUF4407 domain-containing protein [Bacteroidota bacterium]
MLKRFFWFCAGADAEILKRCPHSEHVRYASLGGIVLATGLMAGTAGGFAFYTVFQDALLALGFGFLWGLMIFNLDRYIVASSGKGDGTEIITWTEFKGAIPRIILAGLLGLIISKPLELKIFEPEITSKLQEYQLQEAQERKKATEVLFGSDIDSSYAKVDVLKNEIRAKEARRDEIALRLQEELAGRSGSGVAGEGPTARQLRTDLDRIQREVDEIKSQNQQLIDDELALIKQKRTDREKQLVVNESAVQGFDGLIIRLQLLHDIAPTISWMITLLFLAIETCPIFFKMMITVGPFDDIKKKRESFAVYQAKIEIEAEEAALNAQHAGFIEAQQEVADAVVAKWKASQMEALEANPQVFFDKLGPQQGKARRR